MPMLRRKQGSRPCGGVSWRKRDRTTLHFPSIVEQLEIVSAGEMVHVIDDAAELPRVLKRLKAIAICNGKEHAA